MSRRIISLHHSSFERQITSQRVEGGPFQKHFVPQPVATNACNRGGAEGRVSDAQRARTRFRDDVNSVTFEGAVIDRDCCLIGKRAPNASTGNARLLERDGRVFVSAHADGTVNRVERNSLARFRFNVCSVRVCTHNNTILKPNS